MQSKLYWKILLALVPVLVCAYFLSPWDLWPTSPTFLQNQGQRLKLGPDLAGGTTLIYEVDVPANMSTKQAISDTIEVLQKRVDPLGVKNLIWRASSGNRIEIQMAQPSGDVRQRREAYQALRKELLATDVSQLRTELENAAALADPEQRKQALDQLDQANPGHRDLFTRIVETTRELSAAQTAYETAQLAYNKAKAALNALPPATAPAAKQPQVVDPHLATLEKDLIVKAGEYNRAKDAADAAGQGLRTLGATASDLDRILNAAKTPSPNKGPSPRENAVNALVALHPEKAAQIRGFADAYRLYEDVKGELDDPEDLIALLQGSGVLEFRMGTPPPDVREYTDRLQTQGPHAGINRDYRWFAIDNEDSFLGSDEPEQARQRLHADPAAFFAARGLCGREYEGRFYILLGNTTFNSITRNQPDWKLKSAYPTRDQYQFPAVGLELNTVGGALMAAMSRAHEKQQLAIVLDDRLVSAATINEPLGASFIIERSGSGGFNDKELNYMVQTFKAGSLQTKVSDRPIAIQKTGSQYGQDNLNAGLRAVWWSLVLVGGFMLCYYMFWGVLADLALVGSLVIILGVMAALQATFTLPGIAGLVLTIGMAVDSNVLIFERIREELERKNPLKTAIRLGYSKAFTTIIDTHVTTLITCLILGLFASADVKGFAVTLGIGLVGNLFTAVYCSRVASDVVVDLFNPQALPMLPNLVPAVRRALSPQFDWYGARHWFWGVSAVLTVAGLIGIMVRGNDFLDIEFRGGTQVTFELGRDPASSTGEKRWMDIEQVRQRLTDYAHAHPGMDELAGDRATVVTVGDTKRQGSETLGQQFSIATLLTDSTKVSDAVKSVFKDVLDVSATIQFADDGGRAVEVPPLAKAPVFPITGTRLEAVVGRPQAAATHTLARDYLGGVAILLDQMDPAPTLDDLKARIERMTFQPSYSQLSVRRIDVVPLEAAPASPGDKTTRYRSAAVVCREEREDPTNYLENPDPAYFSAAGGLAVTEWTLVRDALHRESTLGSVNNFSEQVSATMWQNALLAIIASWGAILLYIWIRFGSVRYGSGAVIAMIHDVVVAVGLAALAEFFCQGSLQSIGRALLLQPFRVNLALIASVLTLIGYSVNDTVVVFDRIRENRGKLALATRQIINDAINQTISRTVLTAFTVFVSVAVLYTVGGEGIRGFAFIMLIGTIVGCYSSIAVASPILLMPGWAFKINGGVLTTAAGAVFGGYVILHRADYLADDTTAEKIGLGILLALAAAVVVAGGWLLTSGIAGARKGPAGTPPPDSGLPAAKPAATLPPRPPTAPQPTAK